MKITSILLLLLLSTACTSKTDFGNCVGLGEDQDPTLKYKISGWNIVMGVIFIEMIAPPILVAVDAFYCPVGKK